MIVYDVQFTEPSRGRNTRSDDNKLINAVGDAGNVVLATTGVLRSSGATSRVVHEYPTGYVLVGSAQGSTQDPGDYFRRMRYRFGKLKTLAVASAQRATGKPVKPFGTTWIDYRGPVETFKNDLLLRRAPREWSRLSTHAKRRSHNGHRMCRICDAMAMSTKSRLAIRTHSTQTNPPAQERRVVLATGVCPDPRLYFLPSAIPTRSRTPTLRTPIKIVREVAAIGRRKRIQSTNEDVDWSRAQSPCEAYRTHGDCKRRQEDGKLLGKTGIHQG